LKQIDILAIGNITQDIIRTEINVHYALGGTSYYAYKVASKLGVDIRIISEISRDFNNEFLDDNKIFKQKSLNNTVFENIYADGFRKQNLIKKPGKLLVKNFNDKSLEIKPKIIFYCPIFNEIEYGFFDLFPEAIKVCNLQGLLRKVSHNTIKKKDKLPKLDFKKFDSVILSEIDTSFENALKISESSKIVCYTLGSNGVKIISNGKVKHIKTIKIKKIDETGAGDVWSTSFIIFYYLMSKKLYESALLANISASLSVEGFTDQKIATYKEIINRKKNEKNKVR
tara:strand:- start:9801 stop:10652 length:852 start_codon:yes stop_codon:yes gene_type:complete